MFASKKKIAGVTVGVVAVAGAALAVGAGGAFADDDPTTPPKGARAVVEVTPNPTAERGQPVTITGHCGGGTGLKAVLSGVDGNPVLENIQIVNADPEGFEATANLAQRIGNGVGPVFVDCGGEAGVTLLVTHV